MNKILHGTYASMVSDLAFKRCFGTEEFKEATLGLLNSALPGLGITDVKFIHTELQGMSTRDRKGIIDVLCTTRDSSFIIEMQNARHSHYLERTVFYSSLYVLEQSRRGKRWDFSLKDTFVISFLNFSLPIDGWEGDEYVHHYVMREQSTQRKLPGSSEYLFFELERFHKSAEEVANDMEKWLYLLRNSAEMDGLPAAFEGDGFAAFGRAARIASYSPEEMIQYEKDMVTELDRELELKETRENAYNEGREQGRAEGESAGLKKGLEQGRAEGESAGVKKGLEQGKLETAKAMLAKGLPIEIIVEITGLDVKDFTD